MSKEDTQQEIDKAERARRLKALRNLKNSDGWQILKENLKENIDVLKEQILTKQSIENGKRLDDEEVEILREKYNAQKELLNTPKKLINHIDNLQEEQQRFDPYFENAEEIRQYEKSG